MRTTTLSLSLALMLGLFSTGIAHADAAAPEPTFTLTTDPIALAYETYTLSLARRASSHVALRANVEYTPDSIGQLGGPLGSAHGGSRVAASVPIYLDRTFRGPYVEPGVFLARHRALVVGGLGGIGYGEPYELTGTSIAVGWQSTFASGFTIHAAVGADRIRSGDLVATMPTSYLRVGYAW